MRIAVIGLRAIGPSAAGGVEKAIEELSTRYVQRGHEVTVFCRARYAKELGDEYHGIRIKKLPAVYTKHLEAITNTVAAVLCALRGYDIVHINATGPAVLSLIPRMVGRKVVVTVHGLDWKREKWGLGARWALKVGAWAAARFPNRTVVVSKTLREHYKDAYGKDVVYIPNGVTLPAPVGPHPKVLSGLPKGGYILFLSRLVPEKGCHTLIQAFRRLETDRKLVIVGPPSHSAKYAESLRELAAGDDRILFTGALFGEQKDAIYRGAYVFVLPSTIEGMALVLLEAMSYGKCCLCSDIDENLEVIDPTFDCEAGERPPERSETLTEDPDGNRIAAVFRTGDVESLRMQLDMLLRDPTRVDALAQRARARVASEFDWDHISDQYLDVFRKLVN